MKRLRILIGLALFVLASACRPTPNPVPVTATPNTADPPPAANTPVPGVMVYYEGYAQFELIGSEGRRILIDVYDPQLLTRPPTEDDILLSTHNHGDHYVAEFADAFPGPQLRIQEGSIQAPDVNIVGIASAHGSNELPIPAGGSNYIYVIDMAGLRIAHFGDIGQTELTQEQLDALGDVDVALLLFGGMCSLMEMNSFGLMEQVQPRLMIPTHAGEDALERAFETWDGFYADPLGDSYADTAGVRIEPADLTGEPRFLVLGEWASTCAEAYDLSEW